MILYRYSCPDTGVMLSYSASVAIIHTMNCAALFVDWALSRVLRMSEYSVMACGAENVFLDGRGSIHVSFLRT